MPGTTIEIALIIVLILFNGVFAMAEIALVSSRKARLQQRAEGGDKGAQAALQLAENPNQFLSTLQIGITLVGILAGALGGAALSAPLGEWLNQFEVLAPYSRGLALFLVVLAITYLSLVLGELIPKRLALNSPERVAARLAGPMQFLSRLTSPIVSLLSASTDLGLRVLGIRPSLEPPVTEEEIRVLIEQGTQVGVFEEAEQDMVESVFRLAERRIDALLTPRTEIVWLDEDEPLSELRQVIVSSPYSRFPVAQESLDNVVGVLEAKDLLATFLQNQPIDIRALMRPPIFVPESTSALKVLEMFKTTGIPVAFVIDEYGGLQGMVTHTDVLEAIVGDIFVEGDEDEPGVVQREDGSWLLDGMLPIDEFKELLNLPGLPGEERSAFQTVGGFIVSQLGTIPTAGEHFDWENLRFEVMDMDGMRVDKILVAPAPRDH